MGDEVWFRGEGVGVTPNPAGKDLLDYGDGLYLSDKEDVALQYAKLRAPGEEFMAGGAGDVDPSVPRQGFGPDEPSPRWQKFMTQPMYPGTNNANLNKSRLEYVRMKKSCMG